MVWHSAFNQLSEELSAMITGSDDKSAKSIQEAVGKARQLAMIQKKPVVKFMMKHMKIMTSDINEWIGGMQSSYSAAVDCEGSLDILRGELEDLRNDFTNKQKSKDENIETAVESEVSSWMETVHDSVDEEAKKAVAAEVRRVTRRTVITSNAKSSAKIKRLSGKLNESIKRLDAIKKLQEVAFEEMKARQEAGLAETREMKTMLLEFVKSSKQDSNKSE